MKLVHLQARMKLKSQSKKLTLNYLWWVLEPLLFVSMFYIVFEYLLERGGEDYFSFLIIGKVVYLWFSKSVMSASKGLIGNKNIINQCDIPKWIFPLVDILESTYKAVVSFLVLFSLLWVNGFTPTIYYLHLIPITLLMLIFICSFGYLCSLLVSFAQDFMNLIRIGMTGLMFMSGVFWDINSIQNERIQELILFYNPLAVLINSYRQVLLYDSAPNYMDLVPSLFVSTTLLLLCFYIFKKYNNRISRALFS
ncbi:ABC transporter permease [Vibrio splendidus]|uniref:ABC transporter permease n=1 Tax=Vibrio splendidus TaxID=29497 RepID=UPI0015E7344F|nr:ABC transporter permease [Vibrio splendidus]